jgi:hypothetical protein
MIAASHSLVNTVMIEHPGQLLHMDTVGPLSGSLHGRLVVCSCIVDDYSHYSWVFFLESKDEVFEHFQSLALRLNNEHPNCLKEIRSDNGTKFRNTSFNQNRVVSMVLISSSPPPCVPQQNRVVERKNRTLVEMARMMLNEHIEQMTPQRFWADAISNACYISNRIFLRSILNLVPFEICFGCKPSVSHLRPFGWKCFVLKCGNLDKFESRFFDDILLGYTPRRCDSGWCIWHHCRGHVRTKSKMDGSMEQTVSDPAILALSFSMY